MPSLVKDRLKSFLNSEGIAQSEFARAIGVSAAYINSIRSSVSPEKLKMMRVVYPQLNLEWLLTGRGSMLNSECNHDETANQAAEQMLPLLSLDDLADFPFDESKGAQCADGKYYAVPDFIDRGAKCLIRISGDSMSPRYKSGDMLACAPITELSFLQWGMVYVLNTNQGVIVKRLHEDTTDDTVVICHSENNQLYPPFKMPKSAIRNVYTIVGVIRVE